MQIERERESKTAHKVEINEVKDFNHDGKIDQEDIKYLLEHDRNASALLNEHGDFRSRESIELLKSADIVVTNPPFSLFREYVAQLIEYDKKFLIIGSQNAITYKEIFPLIAQNKMWLGNKNGDMAFQVPDTYEPRSTRFWIDENGQKWRSMGNIAWFTNLDHKKRHEELILYKKYTPEEYPKYDNYDAINVDKVKEIPYDYDGVMGVPITFLDKFNPEQFEIVGCSYEYGRPKEFPKDTNMNPTITRERERDEMSSNASSSNAVNIMGANEQSKRYKSARQITLCTSAYKGQIEWKCISDVVNGRRTYRRILIQRKTHGN